MDDPTDWVVQLRVLAAMCEGYAESVTPHDEACGNSMLFVAKRLKRITDRVYIEHVENPKRIDPHNPAWDDDPDDGMPQDFLDQRKP